VIACILWLGLALPGLQLLPGLGLDGDGRISISLQSALLGIDGGVLGTGIAMAAAGLDDDSDLPSPARLREVAAGGSPRVRSTIRLSPLLRRTAPPPAATRGPDGDTEIVERNRPSVRPTRRETDPRITPRPRPKPPTKPAPRTPPKTGGGTDDGGGDPRPRDPQPAPTPTPGPAPTLAAQTVAFTSSAPATASVGGPAYAVSAVASSGLPVTLAAGPADVCTLAGSTVSFVGAGTCTVRANQPGDARHGAAAEATQTIAVGIVLLPQAIAFTSDPPSGRAVGESYAISATATSGLPVTFSTSSAGVCTVSGSTVSFVGAGTCTVDATQGGNAKYAPAAPVQQSFSIYSIEPSLSIQSIVFTSTPPDPATVGGAAYVIAATASSGMPVSFSVAPSSAGICSVSGATVSFLSAGTCVVRAVQPGGAGYLAASPAQQTFLVARVPQTIAFTTVPPASAVAGGATYSVAATSSSGLPVAFSANPSSTGVCTVVGNLITPVGAGTCTVDADQAGNTTWGQAPQVQQSFTVEDDDPPRSVQAISFTSTPPSAPTPGSAPYTVAATASSGLAVAFSVAPASAGVCSLAGATVSFASAGTCVVRANQAGDASYEPAPQVEQSFDVVKAPQTISFTSTPPSPADVGDPDYTVSATASSGLAVSFAAAPSSAGVCGVSGSTVSLDGPGTCVLVASQAGNGVYAAAPDVQQSFSVSAPPAPSVQSISFTSTPPVGATIGGPDYVVAASASSGLAVSFSLAPSSAGVCTLAGSTVSLTGVGTCTIFADQAGDASYAAAPRVQQAFGVGLQIQTISFTSLPPDDALVGDPAYLVAATATSGLAVTYSAAPSSAGVCTVAGNAVTLVGGGTCTVAANQAGDATFGPADEVFQSFSVSTPPALSVQSIDFASAPPAGAVVGDPDYVVAATASSGLPVALTIAPASAGVCSIAGNNVSLDAVGTCTILADQPGDGNYEPAPQESQSFAISLVPQAISFTSTPPPGARTGDPDYTVSATSTSGLPVTFSIAPASAGVCAVSGAAVSLVAAGTCTISADQAGDSTYGPAASVQQSFTIVNPPAKSVQSITFTSTPPSGAVVGGSAYTVAATASSGLAVTFSVAAASAGVCSLAGSTVSLLAAGTCTILADQGGNVNYQPAPQSSQSFAISRAPQALSFTSSPPTNAAVGGGAYVVAATASSGLAPSFSVAPASTGVCAVSGASVTFLAAGTCTVVATQAGNAAYEAAAAISQSFPVAHATQAISFTSMPDPWYYVGGPTYAVGATASSGLAVSFSIAPASASVCAVSGATVSFTAPGTCVVVASQAGNGSYEPAPQVQQSFTVDPPPSPQTVAFTTSAPSNAVYLGAGYTVAATASSGLPVTLSIAPASAGVCSLSGSFVSWVGAGTCTVLANQAGNRSFFPAAQVQQTFTVAKAAQTITFPNPGPIEWHAGPVPLSATSTSGLPITYSTAPIAAGYCSVSGSTLTPLQRTENECVVHADQPGNENFHPAPRVTVTVSLKNNVSGP
jgi:hypothetical protein